MNAKYQTTDLGISENPKQDKCKKIKKQKQNLLLGLSFSNYVKSKIKKKSLHETSWGGHLFYRRTKIRIISDFSSETTQARRMD